MRRTSFVSVVSSLVLAMSGCVEGGSLSSDGSDATSSPALLAPGATRAPLIVWGHESVAPSQPLGCARDDGASDHGGFGAAVALAPGTLLVGAPSACDQGAATGAVVVFDRSGDRWLESAVVRRGGGQEGDAFGAKLAFSAPYLVAGAPGAGGTGRVDVLERIGWYFYQAASLEPPPGAPPADGPSGFGSVIDVDGATVVAGAPEVSPGAAQAGAVYIYQKAEEGDEGEEGFVGTQIVRQQPAREGARFGRLVALEGHTLAVASLESVSVYTRDSPEAEMLLEQVLPLDDARALALDGGRLAVVRAVGVVELYAREETGAWALVDSLGLAAEEPGRLALDDGRLAVATAAGVAAFLEADGAWGADGVVDGSVPGATDLDLDDGLLVVGDGAGGVSSYRRVASNGEPCGDGLSCESGFCVDGVCCESACGGGEVDCLACSVAAGSSEDGRCEVARAGAVCRAGVGACDRDEVCNGVSDRCPADQLLPENTMCRPPAGGCDVAEVCTGSSAFCPLDDFVDVGVVCRAAAGACDVVEVCDGVRPACPPDGRKAAGTECRERFGPCDEKEVCDGESAACPVDGFLPFGTVCRPANGQCDADERCTGRGASCPADAFLADGSTCADGDVCTEGDQCAAGRCVAGERVCEEPPDFVPDTDAGPGDEQSDEQSDAGSGGEPSPDDEKRETPPAEGSGCGAVPSSRAPVGAPLLALAGFLAVSRRRTSSRRLMRGRSGGALLFSGILGALLAAPAVRADVDGDGVPDHLDVCDLGDDSSDGDGDGTPDACDCMPTDPAIHRGAADICDGVDNDCDGRVDRNTTIYTRGRELVSRVGRGLARNPSARAISVSGEYMVVGPGGNGDVYYAEDVDLVTSAGRREVEVLFRRALRTGDHDFQIAFTDGTRTITYGVFNSEGMLPGAPASSYHFAAEAGRLVDDHFVQESLRFPPGHTWTPNQGAYFVRYEADAESTRVSLRGSDGVTRDAIVFRGDERLDPNVPWTFLLIGNSAEEIYRVERVEVRQPIPARDGMPDLDEDGYSALCDCDDTDPEVHPGQTERCDGKDTDCRAQGFEERDVIYAGSAATLEADWHDAYTIHFTPRESTVEGDTLAIGPGTYPNDIFFLRPVPFTPPTGDDVLEVSVEIDREPRPGNHDLRVGFRGRDGGYFRGVGLYDVDGNGARVQVMAAWGSGDVGSVGTSHELAGGVMTEAGPYLATFRLSEVGGSVTVEAVTVENGLGEAVTVDYPADLPPLLGTLDVALVARDPAETYRIRGIEVSLEPVDTDEDGVCDGRDYCTGFDGSVDADGDGVLEPCDCRGDDPGVHPGALDVCDGVDNDCDGIADQARLAGGVGPELAQEITRGEATGDVTGWTLVDERTIDTPFGYEHGYRKWLGDVRRSDGSTGLRLRLRPGGRKVLALSDGRNAISLDVVADQVWVGTRKVGTLTSGFLYNDPRGLGVVGSNWGVTQRVPAGELVDLVLSEDDRGMRVRAPRPWAPHDPIPNQSAVAEGRDAVLPDGFLDLSQPITVYVYGSDVGEATVHTVWDDADHDFACDARDLCAGHDDRLDSDADGIPDGCDVCLGGDGVTDADGDGWPQGCDCDDTNPDVHPGADDVCNGVDDDCDTHVDVQTLLSVEGAELATRLLRGEATGRGNRAFTPMFGGGTVRVEASSTDGDVFFRQPLGAVVVGGETRLSLRLDRTPPLGESRLGVGLTDGARMFGLALESAPAGDGREVVARAFVSPDEGDGLTSLTFGGERTVEEAPPYDVDFVLGPDPRLEVTTRNGERFTLRPADPTALAGMDPGSLEAALIAGAAEETYLFRSLVLRQSLVDADGDTVCDAVDRCPGGDDTGVDSDQDGIVDVCDICAFGPDDADEDADGVPDACDLCQGHPDDEDADQDGVPDGCDACPGDYANDHDGDGVCDLTDICLGGDDAEDFDGDGIPDACDACPLDVDGDSDEDGSCDSADVCRGNDRSGDKDGDGYCADVDCDDTRASIHPGAEEICDGFDSDCDGALGPGELDTDGDRVIDCFVERPAPDDGGDEGKKGRGDGGEAGEGGCGCRQSTGSPASAGASLGLWLGVGLLVSLARRRRR